MAYLHSITFNGDESEIPSGGGGGAGLESITYSALLAKRNGGQLTPGGQYRITDYVCTTTQAESRAVSHPFDIIVTADDESTLNENARACLHEGDTYYSAAGNSAVLEAWELKYCIDNDTNRFFWADTTNGKGVVYWMKDDKNNECPYDFKQIQFKRYEITSCDISSLEGAYAALGADELGVGINTIDTDHPIWCYTFSAYDTNVTPMVIEDATILPQDSNGCIVLENHMQFVSAKYPNPPIMSLNNIVFINAYGSYCYNNTFKTQCGDNTFGSNCYLNEFGEQCYDNTFGHDATHNTFGNQTYLNAFGAYFGNNSCADCLFYNQIGDSFSYNRIECNFYSNIISGSYCSDNVFGHDFTYNTITNTGYVYRNFFGPYAQINTFSNNIEQNKFGPYFENNTLDGANVCVFGPRTTYCTLTDIGACEFGPSCSQITVDGTLSNSVIGTGCQSIQFEGNNGGIVIGPSNDQIEFGEFCETITIGQDCSHITFGDYCRANTVGKLCGYITFSAGTSSAYMQGYHVQDFVFDSNWQTITISGTTGNEYETYVGYNSSGVLKTWVPANLAP